MRVVKTSLLGLVFAVSAFSQGKPIGFGAQNGPTFGVYWDTRLEPPTPEVRCCGSRHSGTGSDLDSVLTYAAERRYFGYNLKVEPGPGDSYTLTFGPLRLTEALAQELRIDLSTWKQWSWDLPRPQTVKIRDVIALDLLVNPVTGQKVVEYVTIQERFGAGFNNPNPRPFSYAAGAPRDFRVEDAGLHIREPRLSLNGKVDTSSSTSMADVSSPTVWLYAPGKGRFVLSLVERPGFQKAGEVRGTSVSFKVGADTFTLSSAVRIAPGDVPFNLYVFHEPAWRPANTSGFTMGQ